MMNIQVGLAILILGGLAMFSSANRPAPDKKILNNSLGELSNQDPSGFERALSVRQFNFPSDHGAHNRFRTEWWYFTGNLKNPHGRLFGYELTFFRFALSPSADKSKSAWRDNQLYMAHLTLSDVENQKFYVAERFSRAGNQLAGSSNKKFKVWLYDWSVAAPDGSDWPLHLKANNGAIALDLSLKSQYGPILQGNQGLSQKSSEPGNASYYYSYPSLTTEGNISIGNNRFTVSGDSWMDREWSTSALSNGQQGWDWFALQFSDASELMFYQLRRKDGQPDEHSAGALILKDNTKLNLTAKDLHLQVLEYWTSGNSGIRYPAKWQISIPSQQLELTVQPLISDQELNVSYRYWEGAVRVNGSKNGQPISGHGYVELAGY